MSKSDNNPDTDLDQEQEFDTNLGFDDPGQDQTGKNNPLIKIGLIAGALVVVVIGIFMMGGGNNNQLPPSQVGATTANPNALPGQTAPTPEYREAIEERNREQIETAKENNTSVMPLAVDPARATLQGEATQASETVVERHRRIQAEYERQRQLQQAQNQTQMNEAIAQAQAQQVQTLSQSMSTYLNSAMSARSPGGMSEMDIGYTTAGAGDGTGGAAMSGTAGGGGAAIDPSTALPSEPRTLLPAAAVEYGQLLIEANTDAPGPVLALMASGKLAGGRLLGSFSQTEDYITLNFNQVVTKDGRSIPIQAIAIDPDTTLPGMITEIDRKYFERYIIPAAADFISGVGEAIAKTKESTTQTSSSTTTTNNDPKFNEAIAQGISDGFSGLSDAIKESAGRSRPMLRVAAGTPIGILFTQPVLDQTNAEQAREQAALMEASGQGAGGLLSAGIPGFLGGLPQTPMPYLYNPAAMSPGFNMIPGLTGAVVPGTVTTAPAPTTP